MKIIDANKLEEWRELPMTKLIFQYVKDLNDYNKMVVMERLDRCNKNEFEDEYEKLAKLAAATCELEALSEIKAEKINLFYLEDIAETYKDDHTV